MILDEETKRKPHVLTHQDRELYSGTYDECWGELVSIGYRRNVKKGLSDLIFDEGYHIEPRSPSRADQGEKS